jgi:amino acid transporter
MSGRNETSALKANSVSFLESLAQTIGVLAPSAGLALVIPLVFAKAGNATWVVFVCTLVAFLFLVAVFRIFATRSASAGSLGSFGELAFGKWGRILASWTYLVTLVYAISAAVPAVTYYIDLLVYDVSGFTLSGWENALSMGATAAVAAAIGYRGIKLSTDLMMVIECLSLSGIMLLVARAFFREPHWVDAAQFHVHGLAGSHFRLAFVAAFFCLSGFETVTALGEETRQATRTIPRVIVCCIAPIGLLYIIVAYGLVTIFHHGPTSLDQTDAPFEVLANSTGMPWLGIVVSAGIGLSFFASILGCINAGARVLYDMAKNGVIWPGCGRVDPDYGSPYVGIAIVAGLGMAVPLSVFACGTSLADCMSYLLQLCCLAYVAAYGFVALAAPIFLWRIKSLTALDLGFSIGAFLILCTVGVMNLIPVPPSPWNLLPYVFAGSVAAGIGAILLYRTRRPLSS